MREKKPMIQATCPSNNNKQGSSGRYTPLRRMRKGTKGANQQEFKYLTNSDLTMKFTNAKDPIYFAFDYLENRSVPQLVNDFVKDSFFEIANFVSKVTK